MTPLLSLSDATTFFENHYRRAESLLDAKGLHWLQIKRRHTYAVLAATERIITMEPELSAASEEEKRAWQLAALFHDLGRADEISTLGKLEVGRRHFDHAKTSWEILRTHPEYRSLTDVLLACKHHSEIDLSQLDTDAGYLSADAPTRARILRTAKIVRDADKLANLEFFCFDQFQTILNMTEVLPRGNLSPAIITCLDHHKTVLASDRKTLADGIAFFIAWWFDLHFVASRQTLRWIGFPEIVGQALKIAGFDGDGKSAVKNWLKDQ